jgi:hypothetical protein
MIRQTLGHVRRVVVACWHCPDTFACWIRRAYPEWAPPSGHVALVALCGQEGSLIEPKPRSAR